jgi:uncharacterized membrane protein YoaK (UPF0700 family)
MLVTAHARWMHRYERQYNIAKIFNKPLSLIKIMKTSILAALFIVGFIVGIVGWIAFTQLVFWIVVITVLVAAVLFGVFVAKALGE